MERNGGKAFKRSYRTPRIGVPLRFDVASVVQETNERTGRVNGNRFVEPTSGTIPRVAPSVSLIIHPAPPPAAVATSSNHHSVVPLFARARVMDAPRGIPYGTAWCGGAIRYATGQGRTGWDSVE